MRFQSANTERRQSRAEAGALGPAQYADHLKAAPEAEARAGALPERPSEHSPENLPEDLPEKGRRVVCVVTPKKDTYSQTFVRAHIENLPASVKVLYAGDYQSFSDDRGPLVQSALPRRLTRAVLRRSLKLGAGYFEKRALKRFLLDNGVEAVLAEFGPTAVAVMDVCAELGLPLVAHFHGFDAYRRSTLESFGQRYGELFRNAAAIVAVSRDMQRQLISLGAPREKLHYNSCGVDVTTFQGADPLHSARVFVAVGRFVNKKAPHLTLLAFKKVLESYPDARLLMIGDGPLWETCHQLTGALRLSGAVELPGPRAHSEIVTAMRSARAFVQHSVQTRDGDSEGTPVAVLEAGAAGLPVVATRHAGIKDAVVDGETGLLVDEGDIEAMAERMMRLAADAHLAARLGEAARERISSEYSMNKSIDTLWRIIEAGLRKGHAHERA
jgi:colanic acid/amylovoran biosynthesis glycosyltransferase